MLDDDDDFAPSSLPRKIKSNTVKSTNTTRKKKQEPRQSPIKTAFSTAAKRRKVQAIENKENISRTDTIPSNERESEYEKPDIPGESKCPVCGTNMGLMDLEVVCSL